MLLSHRHTINIETVSLKQTIVRLVFRTRKNLWNKHTKKKLICFGQNDEWIFGRSTKQLSFGCQLNTNWIERNANHTKPPSTKLPQYVSFHSLRRSRLVCVWTYWSARHSQRNGQTDTKWEIERINNETMKCNKQNEKKKTKIHDWNQQQWRY